MHFWGFENYLFLPPCFPFTIRPVASFPIPRQYIQVPTLTMTFSEPSFSIERSVIGPLTTVTTFPAGCESYYPGLVWGYPNGAAQEVATIMIAYAADDICYGKRGTFPKCIQTLAYAFYSPATCCPSGWSTVPTTLSYGMTAPDSWSGSASRAISLLEEDETAVFCCPR